MNKLILPVDEAENIIWSDHPDWEEIQTEITSQGRWDTYYEGVFKHMPTNKFYSVCWSKGSTEYQDVGLFEGEKEVEFIEVRPIEKMVIAYEVVND